MPRLLREWHGEDAAREIILSRLPEAEPVGAAVDRVLRRMVSPEELLLQQLREDWSGVVGEPVARASSPHHLHRGVLYVMVRGATLRMELARFHNETILARIRERCGENFCHQLRFIAEG